MFACYGSCGASSVFLHNESITVESSASIPTKFCSAVIKIILPCCMFAVGWVATSRWWFPGTWKSVDAGPVRTQWPTQRLHSTPTACWSRGQGRFTYLLTYLILHPHQSNFSWKLLLPNDLFSVFRHPGMHPKKPVGLSSKPTFLKKANTWQSKFSVSNRL